MRSPTTFAAVAAVAFGWGLAPPSAEAQRPDASRVAAQVQAFYDQTRTVHTAFTQVHYDRTYRRRTRSRGILTIARPGKMRFDYLGGDGKVVVTDGRDLTVYEPGDGGGPGQYARTRFQRGLPAALGLLAGTARLDRDFTFRLRDASRMRWDGEVLELRPRRPEPAYRRVFLFVDASTPGLVRRVLIQDHEGNLNLFVFARTRFNRPVASSRFEFEPPPGARRI